MKCLANCGANWKYQNARLAARPSQNDPVAAVQIDDEWIRYDSIDSERESGAVFFIRDKDLDDETRGITRRFNELTNDA